METECRRNVELMWFLGRLYPDHKSIAEFQRMNREAVTKAGAELVQFARSCGLIRGEWIAIDGSNSARHTYGTYTMEKSGNAFAVSKSMGHADLKSMEPYQHQELEPLRVAINQRNQRKKFGQVFGQVLENES